MPVSTWIAAGGLSGRDREAHSSISGIEPSIGRRPPAASSGPEPGKMPLEHIYDAVRRDGPGAQPLVHERDEEGLTARGGERAHDRLDPQAVGVCLDDRGSLGPTRTLGDRAPVIRERA